MTAIQTVTVLHPAGSVVETMLQGPFVVALFVALAAGVVSFLSPCILPLVPGYLGLLGSLGGSADARPDGKDRSGMGRTMAGVALFVLGFTLVFVVMNAVVGGVGSFFMQYRDIVLRVLGVVLILAGIVFVGRVSFLQRIWKPKTVAKSGLWSAPLIGAAFAIGWTPCSGPVLAAIGTLSITSGSAASGAMLGLMYGLGLGIPFLLMALGFGWAAKSASWVKKHMRVINMIGGAVLIVVGVAMVTGLWMMLMDHLAIWIGSVTTIL